MKYNPSDSNYLNFLASFESIITSAGLTEEEQFTIRNSTVQAILSLARPRLHEHQLAVNREDKLSLLYGHVQQEKHSFAFGKASVIGRASEKMARLVHESASYEAPVNSDGADSTGEQITALSTVVTFTAGGESQPGARRPTRDIDPTDAPKQPTAIATCNGS
ncbi:hypothetical protein SprV_0200847000 [Sparganum proliferum]